MRSILITNDDGIAAQGLIRLARAAQEFGRVYVVAPASQRSAASHSISLHSHIDVFPHAFPVPGVQAYACSGTPGDCVRVGGLNLMPQHPDAVLSGINNGWNVASDIQYSATAGAAFEAAFQGWHAIAFSEEHAECPEAADRYLRQLLAELRDAPLGPDEIFNVNFPGCPAEACRGLLYDRAVSRSKNFRDSYAEEPLPGGGIRLTVQGQLCSESEPGTDMRAVTEGYVSVGRVSNICTARNPRG